MVTERRCYMKYRWRDPLAQAFLAVCYEFTPDAVTG
jgi:hypothetical protein